MNTEKAYRFNMEKGYVQVYTGNGKGKTTAAFGLALRACGAGYKVFVGQFVKSMEYGEVKLINEKIPEIKVELFGVAGCIWNRKPTEEEIEGARAGLERIRSVMVCGAYDVVILDEISIALDLGLLEIKDVIDLIAQKPETVEFVLTGRYFPGEILEVSDLVTDMVEHKHYYVNGVKSRKGIEV